MRIAVLTSLYPTAPRPYEGLFAERRWTRMRSRGHAVTVVQPLPRAPRFLGPRAWTEIGRASAREERGGIEVLRPRYLHLPGRARKNARAFAACGVRCLMRAARPEVVVADYAWPAALAAQALRAQGIPFVVHGRGSDVLQVAERPELAQLLGQALRCAGHWCAVSRDLLERMDALGGRAGQGVLVENGVDHELFRPRERCQEKVALGLPREATLVLVVGHLIPRKDPLLALRAFAAFAARAPGARLAFVGRGPLEAEVRAQARRLLPDREVLLLGELAPEELARWYAACDALLLTSRREGRPNVVIEALSSGRPVLATETPGSAELLAGLSGSLCAERDERALGAALQALLAAPSDPLALRARVAHLTWEAGLAALEGCLRRALEAAGAARGSGEA